MRKAKLTHLIRGLRSFFCVVSILLAWTTIIATTASASQSASLSDGTALQPEKMSKKAAALSIPFMANNGHFHEDVAYYVRTFAGTLFVTTTGELVYSLPKRVNQTGPAPNNLENLKATGKTVLFSIIKESLLGAEIKGIEGIDPSGTKVSHFLGNDLTRHQSGLETYGTVSLGQVYQGIEAQLRAYGNNVEKTFYVAPGADPSAIAVNVEGGMLKINENGELEVKTELGMVKFTKPFAYQVINGEKVDVTISYRLIDGTTSYVFQLGEYDKNHTLVIDPLLASTYIGSYGWDFASALKTDRAGNVYITGYTSAFFPVVAGSYDTSHNLGTYDVFVTKLNADLSQVVASTFIGGNNEEYAHALTLDSDGSVWVTGRTLSTNFPVTTGVYSSQNNGAVDVFIVHLNADLTQLVSSVKLGGSGFDEAKAIATDANGNIYIAGDTNSPVYPTTIGAFSANGSFFVSKFSNDLTQLIASTRFGSGIGNLSGIGLDGNGNVFVSGTTDSGSFPVTPGVFTTNHAGYDIFVSKLDGGLTQLLASTTFGGNLGDSNYAMALDTQGNVFVTGVTESSNFPITPSSYKAGGNYAANSTTFVSKLRNDLSQLLSSTTIGGLRQEIAYALAVDWAGDVYVTGYTTSWDFPTTADAFDISYNGGILNGQNWDKWGSWGDIFLYKLSSDFTELKYSTYLGGSSPEYPGYSAIAVDDFGNIFVSGGTLSRDFPVIPGAFSTTMRYNGQFPDIVLSKFSLGNISPLLTANAGPDQTVSCAGTNGALVILNGSESKGATNYTWFGPFGTATGANPTVALPVGTHTVTLVIDNGAGKTATDTAIIKVQDTAAPIIVTSSTGTIGNNGWSLSAVAVKIVASDSCSGIKEIRYSIDGADQQVVSGDSATFAVSTEGVHIVTYSAVDNAGNQAAGSLTLKIDYSAPVITGAATTQPNFYGWYNNDVVIHFIATDSLSGVASVTPDTSVFSEGANQAITGKAVDVAGNSASFNVIGISIDKTAPVVTITFPSAPLDPTTQPPTYELGLADPTFSATDTLSGIAMSSGVKMGTPDAFGAGAFTYTVTATDKAGNTTSSSASYMLKATPQGTSLLIDKLVSEGLMPQQTAGTLKDTLAKALSDYASNPKLGDNMMNTFLNQINAALNSGKITSDTASLLNNAANYIIAHN